MTTLLAEKLTKDRAALLAAAEGIVQRSAGRPMSVADETEVELALSRRDELGARLAGLGDVTSIRVSEPDLYSETSQHSWFRDTAVVEAARVGVILPGGGADAASKRLADHARHIAPDLRKREQLAARATGDAGVETRDLSLTTGSGGEFVPTTLTMLDRFAHVARSSAPLLRVLPSVPLPGMCQEVVIPRITVSGDIVPQVAENINAPQFWTGSDSITATVCTISGLVPMSQQLYDRSPGLDTYLAADFAKAYAEVAESQIINGTGANGQLLGLANVSTATVDGVPGANLVIVTSASPTPTLIVGAIAEAAAAVGNTRKKPPNAVIMTPERFFAIAGLADGSGNTPMSRVSTGGDLQGGDTGTWGPIAGLPVYLDGSIPQDLGAGSNQDLVAVAHTASSLFLASDPTFRVLIDTALGAESMTVYAQYYVYVAFFSTRYPSAIATVQGTGLVRPTVWA